MPDMPNDALSQVIAYYDQRRKEQQDLEDQEINSKITLIHDLLNSPGANPARTAQGISDLLNLYAAKGGRAKPKKGVEGWMGAHEMPESSLLAGLVHGSIPMQGPTTETIQRPGFENAAVEPINAAQLPNHQMPNFTGKSVLDAPVPIPPSPIQAAPTGNRMLSAARQMQTEQPLPMEKQPMFRSPEEMAKLEGRAAGIKAGETSRANIQSKVDIGHELGATDKEIKDVLFRDWAGRTQGQAQDADGGIWEVPQPDGTTVQVHALRIFDPTTQAVKTINALTGLPLPPNAQPSRIAGGNVSDLMQNVNLENQERAAKGLPPLTAAEIRKIQNDWQQNGKPSTTTIKMDSGMNPAQDANLHEKLAADWKKITATPNLVNQQFAFMKSAMQQINMMADNKVLDTIRNPADQTILVTFQKILDPLSVVRESEYARAAVGQGFLDRLEGYMTRIRYGGSGMTVADLKAFVQMADHIAQIANQGVGPEKARIQSMVQRYKLDPKSIFGTVEGVPTYGEGQSQVASPAIPSAPPPNPWRGKQ